MTDNTPPVLGGLLTQALTDPKLKGLVTHVGEDSLHITGIDQARSWTAGAIARETPVLLVTATGHEAEDLTAELKAMLGDDKVAQFPAYETLPHERLSPAADIVGRRAKVLWDMPRVIVAAARAVCQPVLPAIEPIRVAVDQEADFEDLTQQLVHFAYNHVDMVAGRGEFATRGGIIDVFPTTAQNPVRIEFWGDEVTDIRSFAVADQRTIEELTSVELFPARQLIIDASVAKRADELARTNPSNTTLVQLLTRISEHTHADGEEVLIPVLSDAKYSVLPELTVSYTHLTLPTTPYV